MSWEYSEWDGDESSAEALKQFDSLIKLFNYLLLVTSGNVERALDILRELQEKGYLDEDIDLQEFQRKLQKDNIIKKTSQGYSLTMKGEQVIRKDSLNQIFSGLRRSGFGQHRTPYVGEGGERVTETRQYQFGDSIHQIDGLNTINNAIKRDGIEDIHLQEQDFVVYETEHLTSCATVLLIDISHSMILYGEDRITPAKQVALALTELILSQYPKDILRVCVFGDTAREVEVRDIPYLEVGPFHTNTKAGLQLAQSILAHHNNLNKQIFMITDGKPTAIFDQGYVYKDASGFDPKIINQTLDEASICRRNSIVITTFMVARDYYLQDFVENLTQINHGRAYYASLDRLGEYIFSDYIKNRRRRVF